MKYKLVEINDVIDMNLESLAMIRERLPYSDEIVDELRIKGFKGKVGVIFCKEEKKEGRK